MQNIYLLVTALEKIEAGLASAMTVESLAQSCYCSVSGLQKLFSYVFGHSVGEYIMKRRITAAAKRLISTADSITDIAYDYNYQSPEAF